MNQDKIKLKHSVLFPAIFLLIIWIVKLSEFVLDISFANFGIYPQKLKGLIGIVTSPLIHGSFEHLISNSVPLFLLSVGLFYFYRKVSWKVFFLIYFMTGLWVWVGARSAYHIGASGLVYGLASFLFTSGLLLRNPRMTALSMLVAFLYGGMIWGIFPMDEKISWESHLFGLVAGIVLAFYYKKDGPQREKYDWEDEEDEEDIDAKLDEILAKRNSIEIKYHYKE